MCTCVSGYRCTGGGQRRALAPLELELQALVSHAEWVLGPEHWSSRTAGSTLSC